MVSGEPVSLSECDEMHVAMDFPENLQVAFADRGDRVNLAPVNERGQVAGDRVEAPVNGTAEIEIGEAEQIEASREGLFGARDDRLALAGEAPRHHPDNRLALGEGVQKEPASRQPEFSPRLGPSSAPAIARRRRA